MCGGGYKRHHTNYRTQGTFDFNVNDSCDTRAIIMRILQVRGRLDYAVGRQVMQKRFLFYGRRVGRVGRGSGGGGGWLSTDTDAVAFTGRRGNSHMQIKPDSYRCLVDC